MKAKTIKQVIRAKVDAWIESIEDDAVRALVTGAIAGALFVWCFIAALASLLTLT